LLAFALAAAAQLARAQTVQETVLHNFTPGFTEGASPYSGLAQGSDGVLYGTTWGGGSLGGTVFRMNADGSGYQVLHVFNGSEGYAPYAAPILARDGALYGTTYWGGISNVGTIFKLDTNGSTYSTLYSFTNTPDGANPYGPLIQGRDGALYGTTYSGGASNSGSVFRLNTNGSSYSILHSFEDSPDGSTPFGGVVQGSDGALYGTTASGGQFVVGTVFTLKTNGNGYSVLYSFGFLPDGASPQAGVMQGNDGMLYGTTVIGGTNGYGTVFKLNTNGSGYRTLYCFTNFPDGANSYAPLVQAADGALYGTTSSGGNTNTGAIFRLNPDGSGYSVVYRFADGPTDGARPYAGLVGTGYGTFFGTTLQGGASGFGAVYRLAFPPRLAITRSGQNALLTLTGFPGQPCQLQASTNLNSWAVLSELTLTNGSGQFLDSSAGSFVRRFYRALVR
jgi:uncharacterized repeat protein (TIGR03803 family)